MKKLITFSLILGSIVSCGKKEKSSDGVSVLTETIQSEREQLLASQEVVCEPGTYCPDYVTKIVVFDRGSTRFCSGTLISRTEVLTSASCLPAYLRSTDVNCSEDVHFFFNRGSRPADRQKCKSVIQVSTLFGNKAEYWRDDVAILEIENPIYGRDLKNVSRKGLKDSDKIRFYGIEQINTTTGIIRKEECDVIHNSYIYPLSANESSPNVFISGCANKNGYLGAAILDGFPRIRGVLSEPGTLRRALENSPLLTKPLKEFNHVTSFACAPFGMETSVLNEQECAKALDYASIVDERARLLSDEERFGNIVPKLERTADSASKYFRIGATLSSEGDRQVVRFKPICFKNVNSWINSVKGNGEITDAPRLPYKVLRKGIDSNGRAITQEQEETQLKYYLTFSGKRLYKERLSDVFYSTEGTDTKRINGMKACQ